MGSFTRSILLGSAVNTWLYYLGKDFSRCTLKFEISLLPFTLCIRNIVFHCFTGDENSIVVSGAVIDMIGNYVGSLARAMITFCVAKEEVGKIFSFFAFVDGVLPSLSQLMYSAVFTVLSRIIQI